MGKLKPIYYDTETTGLRFETDRIIEIAAYDPLADRKFCSFINPKIPIPKEASLIHGITDTMVANSPSFETVGAEFFAFCGEDAVLIAHNNDQFDKFFLQEETKRASLVQPAYKMIDTLKWSRKYRSDLPKHSLQFLREIYGVEENRAHRALDDVLVLYKIFSQMIDDLDYDKVYDLLYNSNDVEKMPFGKHKGKPLDKIPKEYLSWLKDQGAFNKPENAALKGELEKLQLL